MKDIDAIPYIRQTMEADSKNIVRAGHYVMLFRDHDGELIPYDTKTLENAFNSIKEKHPQYELVHVQGMHNSATAVDFCRQVRMVTDIRRKLKGA